LGRIREQVETRSREKDAEIVRLRSGDAWRLGISAGHVEAAERLRRAYEGRPDLPGTVDCASLEWLRLKLLDDHARRQTTTSPLDQIDARDAALREKDAEIEKLKEGCPFDRPNKFQPEDPCPLCGDRGDEISPAVINCVSVTTPAARELREARAEIDQAIQYLTTVFKAAAPQWEPFSTLLNLCAQIDNLIAGQRVEIEQLRELAEIAIFDRQIHHSLEAMAALDAKAAEPDRSTTIVRRCTSTRVDDDMNNVPCVAYLDDRGEVHDGCGEPCSWVMRKSGYGAPPWRTGAEEEATATERAAIVAWLREQAAILDKHRRAAERIVMNTAADRIKRGYHTQSAAVDERGREP
jgi:hypothetical protein